MALADPYPLAFLSNLLAPVSDCVFDLIRFEEQSGSGNGQAWTAALADPLWQITINLSPRRWAAAREINTKIWALGTMKSLLFADGSYKPAAGMTAGAGVTVGGVNADRTMLSLTGLTAAYRITAGDRLHISHSGGRYYFGAFAETVTANGSGVTAQIAVEPPLPSPIGSGSIVGLDRPVIRARVPLGNFAPFQAVPGGMSTGASLTLVQKL